MTKIISIEDKVALVTGASRGIGKGIVKALLEANVTKVYAGVRDENSISDLIEKHEDRIEVVKLDVTSKQSIETSASKIAALDILINNAGVISIGNFINGNTLETLDSTWAVNVRGLVAVTQTFFNKIAASNSGAIVSVSSVAGLGNMPFMLAYSATKSAVHSLMQGLRAELKNSNILVATVYPGPVDTDMIKRFDVTKATPESVAKNIINGIQQGVEEIFPDEISKNIGTLYFSSPKEVERKFANF